MDNQEGSILTPNLNAISGGSLATNVQPAGGFMNPSSIAGGFSITEGMKIADFGAGAGYFTIIMAKLTGESGTVTAVDILESALDIVRSKSKNEGLRNIQTIRSNLEILGSSGLANDSQDLVLLANVLFQSDRKEDIIKEAHRVLKGGGALIIIDWKKETGWFGPPDSLRFDPTAMQSLVASRGFEFSNFINTGDYHYGLRFRKISKGNNNGH